MEAPRKTNIAVIGGGPVGFAAAIALAKQGYEVAVYEGRDEIPMNNDNSYPIGVNQRGQDALRRLNPDLVDKLNKVGMLINEWQIYAGKRKVAQVKSGQVVGTTRADVNMILYEESKNHPNIQVFFGHKLESIDFATRKLVFEKSDGSKLEVDGSSDLRVIGADGIWSRCRKEMEAQTNLRVEQGDWKVHFRVIFSKQAASTPDLDPGVHYIMNECYCATVKDGIWVVSLTIKDAQEGSFINDFLLSNDPSDENVFKLKAYLNERAPRMLAILDDDDYRKFFTRSTFTGAVTKCNRYNVDEFLVLLGDAAHSVIPPTGEGVNSGLEDTRYLAEAFQEGPATAFETYNRMRYRDLQYLGAYAWQLKDNLSGTDKAARIANLMFQIFQSTQRKLGIIPVTTEEELFGEASKNYTAYRDVLGKWKQARDAWVPRFYSLVKVFVKPE